MLRVRAAVPAAVGSKSKERAGFGPGAVTGFQAEVLRKEFWEMAKGPVMVTLLSDTPAEPVLVICTSCAALVAPVVSESNDSREGTPQTSTHRQIPAAVI